MSNKVQVQTPYGAWQYVKNSPEGIVYGIYSTNALEGEEELIKCQQQYPEINFRLED